MAACQTVGLVTDWRFNIAYNAALQVAVAALMAAGYQADRSSHHYRVFQSLPYTLGTDSRTIQKLDVFRKKRNIADYERANVVSELEAEEMLKVASKPREEFDTWIAAHHPSLKL